MQKKRIYDRVPVKEEEPASPQFDAQSIQKVMAPPPFDPGSSSPNDPTDQTPSQLKSIEKSESEPLTVETSALANSLSIDSSGPSSEKEASLEGPVLGNEVVQRQENENGKDDPLAKGGGAYGRLSNVKTNDPEKKT